MDISQTFPCELLCQKQDENGCCYLGKKTGCRWGGGAKRKSTGTSGEVATAVACARRGIFL